MHFEFELKYNIILYRLIIELIFQERWRRVHLHRWEQSWSSSWSSASRRCFLWELRASYLFRNQHDLKLFLISLKLRADVHRSVSELGSFVIPTFCRKSPRYYLPWEELQSSPIQTDPKSKQKDHTCTQGQASLFTSVAGFSQYDHISRERHWYHYWNVCWKCLWRIIILISGHNWTIWL